MATTGAAALSTTSTVSTVSAVVATMAAAVAMDANSTIRARPRTSEAFALVSGEGWEWHTRYRWLCIQMYPECSLHLLANPRAFRWVLLLRDDGVLAILHAVNVHRLVVPDPRKDVVQVVYVVLLVASVSVRSIFDFQTALVVL